MRQRIVSPLLVLGLVAGLTSVPAASIATATPGSNASAAASKAACSVLSAGVLHDFFGGGSSSLGVVPGEPAGVRSCGWSAKAGSRRLFLYIFPSASTYASELSGAKRTGHPTVIHGLGQKAYEDLGSQAAVGAMVVFIAHNKTYAVQSSDAGAAQASRLVTIGKAITRLRASEASAKRS
jgi:hypothetical protein